MRYQLPGYSPLRLGGLLRAGVRSGVAPREALRDLSAHLQRRFQAEEVLLLDSGTHALQVALDVALRETPPERRRVALPAYSCFDLATAVVAVGTPVTFYDLDPLTLCPEPSSFRRALESGAGVVVAANLYGFPLDWSALRLESDAAGALVVEDAAQGIGSRWGDAEGGSLGDLTVLSFGRGKGWTGGGGGALLSRGAGTDRLAAAGRELASRARGTRTAALALAQWLMGRPWLYGLPASIPALGLGETRYHAPSPPRAMDPFAAAALDAHADLALRESEHRRSAAAEWVDRIEARCPDAAARLSRPVAGGAASHLRLPLLWPVGAPELVRRARRLGLARGYPLALPELSEVRALLAPGDTDLPSARTMARELVTLPTHSLVTPRDQERILRLLDSAMCARQ